MQTFALKAVCFQTSELYAESEEICRDAVIAL